MRRPDAHQQAGQGGFAGRRRADDAQRLAGRQVEVDPAQDGGHATRGGGHGLLDRQQALGLGQRHGFVPRREVLQQLGQALPGTACGEQLLPHADGLLHRRHGTAAEDGAGDHHPGGDLALDGQQGAGTQDQRLQGDPHEAAGAVDVGGAVGRLGLLLEDAPVAAVPALADRRQHAHGLDHFGIAQVVVGEGAGGHRGLVGLRQRAAGDHLGEQGQGEENHRADQGDDAQQRVYEEDHQQVDGRPGSVEEGEQAVTGEELANLGQVLQGLRRVAAGAAQVALEGRIEDALVQAHVQPVAEADQHRGTHHLQQRHQHVEPEDQHREHHQGGDVAAGQHAVVDLHHVHRRRQHHQVDDPAETADHIKGMAQAFQSFRQLGTGLREILHLGAPLADGWIGSWRPYFYSWNPQSDPAPAPAVA
ncbi:hypothetical protein D9M69_361660 [compost metagenome]